MRNYEKILTNEPYLVFDHFTSCDKTYDTCVDIIKEAISLVAGDDAVYHVEQNGLSFIHEVVSPDFLPFINRYIVKHATSHLLPMSASFGKEELEIEKDFFVDGEIISRIHYPFPVARKSKLLRQVYLKLDIEDIKHAREQVDEAYEKYHDAAISDLDIENVRYNKNLPVSAIAYGPHRDTWFGHTYGGINLWWSICWVTEQTGMAFYPELMELDLPHTTRPNFITEGTTLPKPTKVALPDGGMLAFNAELLHATNLNVTDQTRIVLSTRINPKQPKFYEHTKEPTNCDWHLSSDVLKGNLDNILHFPREDNIGIPDQQQLNSLFDIHRRVTVNRRLMVEKKVPVFAVDSIGVGEKCLVNLEDVEIVVVRSSEGWRGVSALCPHLGINLIDGNVSEGVIYCPGHGVAYNLEDGKSTCRYLNLRTFKVTEESGRIVLHA
jgi:nitrite reductase/ring-hydroxylating ferredoxin subunit